ncbi:carbohydrate ABC transporter permease [Kribbella sp. NPDC055110]
MDSATQVVTSARERPLERDTPRLTPARVIGNLPYYVVLGLWAALTIFILLWLFSGSLKNNVEIFGSPWALPKDPAGAATQNYDAAWTTGHMGLYFINSVLVTSLSVVITVAISAPAAYVLSRIPFRGSTLINYYFIAGMGLPFQLILVPLYVLLVQIGLIDTRAGLTLTYVGVSIPFTIILLTGFFRSLPSELEEAGAVDGCSELGIFWRIMMPIATPGLFTAAIFNFVMIWQEFLLAQLLLSSDGNKTLPVGLMGLRQTMQYNSNWAAMFAAVMIIVVPSFIVFVALSNRIMAGLTLGAGK